MNMKRAYGFTLIELMFVIVVSIILVTLGIISFKILASNNRATTQANALYSALNYARSEAIGRAMNVTVCPKATASVTSTTCGTNTNWANGWMAFTDVNATGGYVSGDGDTIIKHWEPLPGTPTLATTQAYIGFNRDGSKNSAAAGTVSVHMSETDTTGTANRCVSVSAMGMVRVNKTSAGACP